MSELIAGMLVRSSHKDIPFGSGAEWCPAAVVAQVDPFILISEEGDMMWTKCDPDDFEQCGVAGTQAKLNVNDRIGRIELDSNAITPLTVTDMEIATLWFSKHGDAEVDLGKGKAKYGSYVRSTTRVKVEDMYQAFKTRMESDARGSF